MSFSASIPVANIAAANAALQAVGWGPNNFSVPERPAGSTGDATHAGLSHLGTDAAFQAAVAAIPGVTLAAYGALVNSQMRVRQMVQGEVERSTAAVGMPGRTELDSVHKRVHDLRRRVASLEEQLAEAIAAMKAMTSSATAAVVAPKAAPAKTAAAAKVAAPAKAVAKAKPAPKRKPAAAKQAPTAPAKPVEKSAGAAMPKSSNRRSRS